MRRLRERPEQRSWSSVRLGLQSAAASSARSIAASCGRAAPKACSRTIRRSTVAAIDARADGACKKCVTARVHESDGGCDDNYLPTDGTAGPAGQGLTSPGVFRIEPQDAVLGEEGQSNESRKSSSGILDALPQSCSCPPYRAEFRDSGDSEEVRGSERGTGIALLNQPPSSSEDTRFLAKKENGLSPTPAHFSTLGEHTARCSARR